MKKFLLKVFLYLSIIGAFFLSMGFFADGNTDDNYRHFLKKGSNVIFGDSRGSQAIVPSVLKQSLGNKDFDNFSMNITETPYGEIYLKAIKRKVDENTKDGIFILTVDPWNLSVDTLAKGENIFTERGSAVDNMHCYNMSPNFEYLVKNYKQTWFYIFRDRERLGVRSNTYLHEDGWMEVTVDMSKPEVDKRIAEKIEFYKMFSGRQKLSQERISAFKETISFLKNHGKVYIVRIPGSEDLMKIEEKYAPNFDQLMIEIGENYDVDYINFSKNYNKYIYTDGNHMYKESGKVFTKEIADSIQYYQTKNSGN